MINPYSLFKFKIFVLNTSSISKPVFGIFKPRCVKPRNLLPIELTQYGYVIVFVYVLVGEILAATKLTVLGLWDSYPLNNFVDTKS